MVARRCGFSILAAMSLAVASSELVSIKGSALSVTILSLAYLFYGAVRGLGDLNVLGQVVDTVRYLVVVVPVNSFNSNKASVPSCFVRNGSLYGHIIRLFNWLLFTSGSSGSGRLVLGNTTCHKWGLLLLRHRRRFILIPITCCVPCTGLCEFILPEALGFWRNIY